MEIKKPFKIERLFYFVRVIGLEPTRREAPDPKSGVSTNFTTPASGNCGCKYRYKNDINKQFFLKKSR